MKCEWAPSHRLDVRVPGTVVCVQLLSSSRHQRGEWRHRNNTATIRPSMDV